MEQQIQQTESAIESHEKQLKNLTLEMEKASQLKSSTKITTLAQEIHNCQSDIDQLFNTLEELTARFEHHDKEYAAKLHES